MGRPVCLLVDAMHESILEMLTEIGWEPSYQPDITRDEIKKIHHGYQGIIVRSKTTIDHDLLGNNPTIKFIGRAGAGLDNLDLDYLGQKNIAVVHASEGNRDAVGEYTIGALLSLMRNIPRANQQVRKQVWDREGNRGEEIMGKTVGIIGYGNMGRAFAQRLAGFGCTVLAYDKYKSNYGDQFATQSGMDELYDKADILSLHIPLTSETKRLVSFDFLNRFKKKIVLINTARGEIVALTAVVEALKSGQVRGAVLDVLENEKLSTLTVEQKQAMNYLGEQTNVILTPHIAGWTFESHVKINVALVQKLQALRLTS